MSLASLALGAWLVLVGISWMEWAVISFWFLGIWAFVTGILWLLQGFGVWSYNVGRQ